MRDVVEIEQYLDVSCPWCHGGIGTNRRMLDELAADPSMPAIRLRWLFLRLRGELPRPGRPVEEYYASWAGDGASDDERTAAVEDARADVREYVTSVGARVDEDRYVTMHDPLVAHSVLALVRDDDGHDLPDLWSLARALFAANFVHGVDITDVQELRASLAGAGLVLPDRLWTRLGPAGDGYGDETRADRAHALAIGLDGVPRLRVGGEIVPTWIDPVEARRRLRAAIASARADDHGGDAHRDDQQLAAGQQA